MITRLNGWLPVLLAAMVVLTIVIAVSVLAALKTLDAASVTFVFGGALGWAGGQRSPIRDRQEDKHS